MLMITVVKNTLPFSASRVIVWHPINSISEMKAETMAKIELLTAAIFPVFSLFFLMRKKAQNHQMTTI